MSSDGVWRHDRLSMNEKLKFALESGLFADATIVVQAKEFRVVRFLMQLSSPYFETAFQDNKGARLVYHCDPRHFGSLIKFIYTGELEWNRNLLDAVSLLKIARQFQVEEMVNKVSNLLDKIAEGSVVLEPVTQNEICQVLEESRSLELPEIEKIALGVILRNGQIILSGNAYLSLTVGSLCRIIEHDDLQIANEMAVFIAVRRWAEERLARPSSGKNLRTILKNIIPLIRFPNMSKQHFLDHVYGSGLLESEQLLAIMDLIVGKRRRSVPPNPFNGKPRLYSLPPTGGSIKASLSTETLIISPADERRPNGSDGEEEDGIDEQADCTIRPPRNVSEEIEEEVDDPECYPFCPVYD